jgi:hypothetical protein
MNHLTAHRTRRLVALVAALGLVVTACGDDSSSSGSADTTAAPSESSVASTETTAPVAGEPVIDPGDDGNYQPEIDPADFVAVIDNPYLPLVPGSRWSYEETNEDGQIEDIDYLVTDQTREIAGVTTTVIRDTVTIEGVAEETTLDFFAQDREGNVWYFGEEVSNYDENGDLLDHDGSFEVGVDGALPGIVMEADPQVGDAYRQEYYLGEAEDMGEVIRSGETVSVPAGDYVDVLVTRDWNPLEPEVIEEKYYAPGVGIVREVTVAGHTGEGVLVDVEIVPSP